MQESEHQLQEQSRQLSAEEGAEIGSNVQSIANNNIESDEIISLSPRSEASIYCSSRNKEGRKKRINIGEYEITFPEEKIPLLGVMACAILLHISIFIDDYVYTSKFRYGIFLSMFAFFGGLVSTAIPTKKAIGLNYLIYFCTFSGACMSTFEMISNLEAGPFAKPGNGYFSVWGLAICSGIAADPPGSLKRAHFNSILNLGASAVVVVLSLLPYIVHGSEYIIEVYICISIGGLTVIISSLICILKICTWTSTKSGGSEAFIITMLACLWLGTACVATFRGPFIDVGNGYFASWFAVVMGAKAATLTWRDRIVDKSSNE